MLLVIVYNMSHQIKIDIVQEYSANIDTLVDDLDESERTNHCEKRLVFCLTRSEHLQIKCPVSEC